MTLKISISGVRGLFPDNLTEEVCLDFARAFGTYLAEEKGPASPVKVAVGCDPRASSKTIQKNIFQGLLSTGCNVIDLGICPTPTVGIMTRKLKADGGIVVTASHNPLPWNGMKFMRSDGIFLNQEQANKLIQIYHKKRFKEKKGGSVTPDPSAIEVHIKNILGVVDPDPIRRKKFKVALDGVNGAGSVAGVRLLGELGCKIEAINCDMNSPFPHEPEPIAKNLVGLCDLVKMKKADIGFAFDPDADRLAIVSDEGKAVGEEMSLALAVKHVLNRHRDDRPEKKTVAVNLSTSRMIDDVVREHGGTLIRTRIGEVHVAEELKKIGGLIGGEGNGGIIYPPIGFNRDALGGLALILSMLAGSGKKISALVSEIPSYYMLKTKIECQSIDQADDLIAKIKENFKEHDLVLTEGVKVLLPAGWIHVRASNTEPVIRIIAEGKRKEEIEALVDQVLEPLR